MRSCLRGLVKFSGFYTRSQANLQWRFGGSQGVSSPSIPGQVAALENSSRRSWNLYRFQRDSSTFEFCEFPNAAQAAECV